MDNLIDDDLMVTTVVVIIVIFVIFDVSAVGIVLTDTIIIMILIIPL